MDKIIISRCLLGEPVRYDGQAKALGDPRIDQWQQQDRLIAICPEMAGGLPCPRAPAEISNGCGSDVIGGNAKVITHTGTDVTEAFLRGAQRALALCQQHNIRFALLKARSPSCGSQQTYDGSFSNRVISGEGVTAALLSANGIRCFDETDLDHLAQLLDR